MATLRNGKQELLTELAMVRREIVRLNAVRHSTAYPARLAVEADLEAAWKRYERLDGRLAELSR